MKNYPFNEIQIDENTRIRRFSSNVPVDDLVWHRDKNDRIVEVISGEGWMFQRDNSVPKNLVEGEKISISKNEWHRVVKGEGDLVLKIIEEKKDQNKDGKNDFDDVKIARMKASGMSDEEIKKKHPELFEKYINEKKKRKSRKRKKKKKTDFHKGGEASYRKGRSSKQLSKQISLTRAYNSAKTEKQKQKIRDKIDRSRERERKKEGAMRLTENQLKIMINDIVEEIKLDAVLNEIEDRLDEKRRKKRKKRKKKKKSGSRTLSKAVKKSLNKKADRRCLTRGSVYAEFRAGLGAYYSSGSRKGMSAHQWAHARVNSANPSKKWAKVKKRKKCPKKKK